MCFSSTHHIPARRVLTYCLFSKAVLVQLGLFDLKSRLHDRLALDPGNRLKGTWLLESDLLVRDDVVYLKEVNSDFFHINLQYSCSTAGLLLPLHLTPPGFLSALIPYLSKIA